MNAKKVKKLRQLARHLNEKSGGSADTLYKKQLGSITQDASSIHDTQQKISINPTYTYVLDPTCTRALYKAMKGQA